MKTFYVDFQSEEFGIAVDTEKYPHITLGAGGHKRATWVGMGSRDADKIIADDGRVHNAGIVRTRKGGHIIVAPRGNDDRALVLWSLPSGYRGGASIEAPDGVKVIAYDKSWHSGRGSLGEDAQMLAILRPGDELRGHRTGRRVQFNDWVLRYDGTRITVDPAVSDETEVDYNEFFKFRADAMAFFNREAGKDCVILNSKWDDEEYRNLPPDSDLVQEWREHDRARGG